MADYKAINAALLAGGLHIGPHGLAESSPIECRWCTKHTEAASGLCQECAEELEECERIIRESRWVRSYREIFDQMVELVRQYPVDIVMPARAPSPTGRLRNQAMMTTFDQAYGRSPLLSVQRELLALRHMRRVEAERRMVEQIRDGTADLRIRTAPAAAILQRAERNTRLDTADTADAILYAFNAIAAARATRDATSVDTETRPLNCDTSQLELRIAAAHFADGERIAAEAEGVIPPPSPILDPMYILPRDTRPEPTEEEVQDLPPWKGPDGKYGFVDDEGGWQANKWYHPCEFCGMAALYECVECGKLFCQNCDCDCEDKEDEEA
jgi:hypothetical protein